MMCVEKRGLASSMAWVLFILGLGISAEVQTYAGTEAVSTPTPDTVSARRELFSTVKKMILSQDNPDVRAAARLLDQWSEALIVNRPPPPFKDELASWTQALGWCVERQTLPEEAGGAHFRRILFRHAWLKALLAEVPISERKQWLNAMMKHIHADTPVVEPFFLNTLWTMPTGDRLAAVHRLGERLNRSSSRLLVALTLHTLVPQSMIDAARHHLMLHSTGGKDIYRDLASEIQLLRLSSGEESPRLKDAVRIGLRSSDVKTRMTATDRVARLLESDQLPRELVPAVIDCVEEIFAQKRLELFSDAYAIVCALHEQKISPPDFLIRYLDMAREFNPFDAAKGGRYIVLNNSRSTWIDYLGMVARQPALTKQERLELTRLLMAVPDGERHESGLRAVLESIVSTGLIGKSEFETWKAKRKIID